MKHILVAGLACTLLASPALAEGMSNAIGHAVRVTDGGQSFDAWFNADGSYSDTRGVTGTWTYQGQLCIRSPPKTDPVKIVARGMRASPPERAGSPMAGQMMAVR